MGMLKNIVAMAAAFLCACSSVEKNVDTATVQSAAVDASKMGVILPLSDKGANGAAAAEILSGMRLAIIEENAGGKSASLEIRDCAVEDFAFAETLDSMSSKGIKCFHVGLTDNIVSQYKIFGRLDDCFFNLMTTYPPATTGAKNTTRIFLNGAQEGDLLTEQIEIVDRKQCYVVMNVDTLCGRSNAAYFCFNLNKGTAKAYTDVFKSGEKNFGIFSAQIMRLLPKYVFYIGDGSELNSFSKSVRQSGYNGVLLATCGFEPLSKIEARRGLRFGKLCTAFETGKVANPVSEKFKKAYAAKFGRQPNFLAAYGYDAVKLFLAAGRAQNNNVSAMRKFFESKNFTGAVGELKFDSSADPLSELEIVEIK